MQNTFVLSSATPDGRSFVIEIDGFNTTEVFKPAMSSSTAALTDAPIGVLSASAFDRFAVYSTGGANNIASGTLYWWGAK